MYQDGLALLQRWLKWLPCYHDEEERDLIHTMPCELCDDGKLQQVCLWRWGWRRVGCRVESGVLCLF